VGRFLIRHGCREGRLLMGVVKYPVEFRQRAVQLARSSDRPLRQIAAELGVNYDTFRGWVRQDHADPGAGHEGLSVDERAELARLRKRVTELELEKEILKKAAVFFAKETGR
jgi:transposase